MAKRSAVSLELLQALMQRMLESQREVLNSLELMRNRLERVERALLAGQRLLLDRTEADTEIQHQLDDVTRRLEALEEARPP